MNYNPFHGGTIQITRVGISQKSFENNPKYKDYVKDEYHSNEFYSVFICPSTGDALLVKLKK